MQSNPIGTQEEILERLATFLDSLSTSEDNGFIRLENGRVFGSREAYTHIVRGDDFAFKWDANKYCGTCHMPKLELPALAVCSCARLVYKPVGAKTL